MAEPVVVPTVEPVTEPVTAPVVAPVVAPVAEPVVAPAVEPDFSWDTWNQSLDEDLRTEKSLESFKHAKSKDELLALVAKSFVNTKKMVGANVIAIPTDISTEGEWQEFHKAGGRPETVADYNLKRPDEFPEEYYSQEFADAAQELLFKFGASKKLADALHEMNNNRVLSQLKLQDQAKETARAELESGLATDWGAAFEQKKHLGNMAVTEGTAGDDEFKARLTKKFGDDPDFIRFAANLGGKFAEGKPPGFGAIPTPDDYQDQIEALMADPLYTKGTQQQRMRIADKIMAIRKLQKPEPVNTQ